MSNSVLAVSQPLSAPSSASLGRNSISGANIDRGFDEARQLVYTNLIAEAFRAHNEIRGCLVSIHVHTRTSEVS